MRRISGFCIAMVLAFGTLAQAFELPDAVVTASELNVRRRADISSDVFWKLRQGENVKVKAINGEWYKVRLPEEKEGYVHNKYLDVRVWGRVYNQGAWVYNLPDTGSQVIADMRGLSWIRVTNRWQLWYGVELPGGTRGWVYQDALEVPQDFFAAWLALQNNTPPPSAYAAQRTTYDSGPSRRVYESAQGGSAEPGTLRYQIVEYAKKFIGTPYVYGGATPSGFDCSGFVLYVFKQHGIALERVSRSQATMGTYVSKDQLLPGDLVFFSTNGSGSVSHAGIYIGNGDFIHSSSSNAHGKHVRISPLNDGYYSERYTTGRRIIN